jgi:hypothetical protein
VVVPRHYYDVRASVRRTTISPRPPQLRSARVAQADCAHHIAEDPKNLRPVPANSRGRMPQGQPLSDVKFAVYV